MAKFRNNHRRKGNASTHIARTFIITFLFFALVAVGLKRVMPKQLPRETARKEKIYTPDSDYPQDKRFFIPHDERLYIPDSTSEVQIHHFFYSLGYDENLEQSRWVAYELTKKSIQIPNVDRYNWYMSDGLVETGSAEYHDYSGSQFTRGHLAPAGDMAFSFEAMKESFLMSNMSPQLRNFNAGVWNELEQTVRDWAYDKTRLIVVTGPLFFDDDFERIGNNGVAVPHAFYKAVLDPVEKQAAAFVVPHEVTDLPLKEFVNSINELERLMNFDLFSAYFDSEAAEDSIEGMVNLDNWPFNEARYLARVNKWNNN